MKRFLRWRKMTWAIAVWSGAMLAWFVVIVVTASDPAAGCATDSAGAAATALTQRECVEAAGLGVGGSTVLIAFIWLAGVLALGVIWFVTRPLWRQGHGARLRRLRPERIPWLYDAPPTQAARRNRIRG